MKNVMSVRLEPDLQGRLEQAAQVTGRTPSEIVREAVEEKVAALLGVPLSESLAGWLQDAPDFGPSDLSLRTGAAFAEGMRRKAEEGRL
jgi:predicted transcriptional regulator